MIDKHFVYSRASCATHMYMPLAALLVTYLHLLYNSAKRFKSVKRGEATGSVVLPSVNLLVRMKMKHAVVTWILEECDHIVL